jgi:urea transport system substrate-binding protein
VLAGTDYVYPRTTNKILEQYLKDKGVAAEDIMINYTPFGHSDWQTIVSDIKAFGSAGKKTAVVSTINGDANVPFYKELGQPGHQGRGHPGRRLLGRRRRTRRLRHRAAGRPPRRLELLPVVDTPENAEFIKPGRLHRQPEARDQRPDGSPRHRLQPVGEGGREGRHHRSRQAVLDAIIGLETPNLTGGIAKMLPNHHITKPVLIGEIQADGQFDVVWETEGRGAGRRLVRLPARVQDDRGRLGRRSTAATTTPRPRPAARGTASRWVRCCCSPPSALPSPSA